MDKFSNFNPKVCFLFFVFAVLLILLNFNPIFLVISLLAGVIYNAMLQGKKAFKMFFAFLLPFTILIGLLRLTELMFSFQFQIRILLPRGLPTACAKELCFQA